MELPNYSPEEGIPNNTTLVALREVEAMKANPSLGKSYDNVDEMLEDLLN